MISCILLSAGESIRFGSPKALAKIHHSTALEFIQQQVLQSNIAELIVVTGAHENLIKPVVFNHSNVRIVYNKDYKLGQTSSFQAGVMVASPKSEGFMLLPVDCPLIKSATFNKLIDCFEKNKPAILIPTYQSKKGHPPIFHQQLKEEILNMDVQQGINALIRTKPCQIFEIDDPGIVLSFNTQEELNTILNK